MLMGASDVLRGEGLWIDFGNLAGEVRSGHG
jgi:hypothetical protein